MSRVGLQVAAVAALIAVLLLAPGGARAADGEGGGLGPPTWWAPGRPSPDPALLLCPPPSDATAALLQMMDGDISLLGDDSLSSLFLSLADMSTNPQVMQTVQAVRTSVGSPAASSEPAASSGPAATGTTGASSEAALVGDLFDALFTGADSPLSTFLAAADGGGVSSQLAALLGPISSGAAARSTSAASAPMLRTSLGSLLGGATGTAAGTSAGSSPLSALLQPVASTRSVLDQLAQAVQAADSVLNLPHYDDLFGGAPRCLLLAWARCPVPPERGLSGRWPPGSGRRNLRAAHRSALASVPLSACCSWRRHRPGQVL